MSTKGPTKKQAKLLDFIESYMRKHDVSPSYREIRDALGLSSVSAVAEHIENCVAAGYLRKIPNAARTLEVLCYEKNEETENLFNKKMTELNELQAANPDDKSVADDIATLRAAAKILRLRIHL
jgi:repressor LexA